MPRHKKPKFKLEETVVYGDGNWKYRVVEILWDKDGNPVYHLECNEDDELCDRCQPLIPHMEVMGEDEILGYEEWCEREDNND
jgi:hypothetical protein